MTLRYLLKTLLLPPASQFLLLILAALLWRAWPRLSKGLVALSLISLWLLSTPWISQQLSRQLEQYPALEVGQLPELTNSAQAIVILAGGMESEPQELGYAAPTINTLIRLRYGAFLHRETGLPILVSGGRVFADTGSTLADAMSDDLNQSFRVSTRWRESRSRTTAENALFSADILAAEGIDQILLVTESFHMPRAVYAFEQAGLKVIAAPTRLAEHRPTRLLDWVPTAASLHSSSQSLHEWLGLMMYRIQ